MATVLVLSAAVFGGPAHAVDAALGIDATLQAQLVQEARLSPLEVALVAPEVLRYVALHGDVEHLVEVLGAALERDCWGVCLVSASRALGDAMELGMQDLQASSIAIAVLDAASAERDAATELWTADQHGAEVELRFDRALVAWTGGRLLAVH